MPRHYVEVDAETAIIYDETGQEVAWFRGEEALGQALLWAETQSVDLYSTRDPDDLRDQHRLLRRLRIARNRRRPSLLDLPPKKDPPNVRRIVIEDFEGYAEDDIYEDDMGIPHDPIGEEIDLAPHDGSDDF